MLQIILDTNKLNTSHPEVLQGLDIDLRRMKKLNHSQKPSEANAVKITARNGVYFDSINYEIQYGRMVEGQFDSIGQPKKYPHEVLPLLS